MALKVLTADLFGHGQDTFEVDILRRISRQNTAKPGASHVLGLLDEFEHHEPNENHVYLVSKAMGPDMAEYRRLFPKLRIPLPLMKSISRQILLALSYHHDACRVIHTGQSGQRRAEGTSFARDFRHTNGIADIKLSNISAVTSGINEMFHHAPSEVFAPDIAPMDPSNDFTGSPPTSNPLRKTYLV